MGISLDYEPIWKGVNMQQSEKKLHREDNSKNHGYRVYIKHSNNDRSLTDCMKEVIKTTLSKSLL